MAEKNVAKTPLFDLYVQMTDDEARGMKTVHARKRLMRNYQSAYDDAELQISSLNLELGSMLEAIRDDPSLGVSRFDVNKRLHIVSKIADLEAAREFLANDYEELFGEKIA